MRTDAIPLENGRLEGKTHANYPWIFERHRIFPGIFPKGRYGRILDIAAGVGLVAKRIQDNYECEMICNDISTEALRCLHEIGLKTVSFDLDNENEKYPFPDYHFDAIVSLATIEHILNLDHHLNELHRILKNDGHLYLSAPNYSGLHFFISYVFGGRSFHNPMKGGLEKYEFYAHIRYFTYKTLLEFTASFGFKPEIVFLPLPKGSTKFLNLKKKAPPIAFLFRLMIAFMYALLPPRWALHPVIMFSKCAVSDSARKHRPKKKLV